MHTGRGREGLGCHALPPSPPPLPACTNPHTQQSTFRLSFPASITPLLALKPSPLQPPLPDCPAALTHTLTHAPPQLLFQLRLQRAVRVTKAQPPPTPSPPLFPYRPPALKHTLTYVFPNHIAVLVLEAPRVGCEGACTTKSQRQNGCVIRSLLLSYQCQCWKQLSY